jgi:murein DD-endopeptidase MepM/ murein hydrolase activator NlpD
MKLKHTFIILAFVLSFILITSSHAEDQKLVSAHSIVFPLIAPKLSSSYGSRIHPIKKMTKHHSGVDLAAPEKSHVRAVMSGRVVFAGTLGGYGNVVSISHGNEKLSLYGHLREIHVEVGSNVDAGKIIGLVGSTGSATGPHLHFEWREHGKPVDPMKIFPHIALEPLG